MYKFLAGNRVILSTKLYDHNFSCEIYVYLLFYPDLISKTSYSSPSVLL